MTEGFLDFRGYKTWYAVHGEENSGTPLFVLHGGPGYPHNAQNNLSALAENGFPVVMYDQLGCGLSDKPTDMSLFNVELFVDELDALRKLLGFEIINVIGASWGGSLALEYCLEHPENVDRLVLHSPLIDSKLWVEEADKLKDLLPDNSGARMIELERSGNTDNDEYRDLAELFNDNFLLRIKPWPQDFTDMINGAGKEIYNTMWGPSEAYATGILKEWSVIDRLKNIEQKTLLISGKYDEATPKQMQIVAGAVPDIQWQLFENSSHCANLEEPEKYMQVVADFLKV